MAKPTISQIFNSLNSDLDAVIQSNIGGVVKVVELSEGGDIKINNSIGLMWDGAAPQITSATSYDGIDVPAGVIGALSSTVANIGHRTYIRLPFKRITYAYGSGNVNLFIYSFN